MVERVLHSIRIGALLCYLCYQKDDNQCPCDVTAIFFLSDLLLFPHYCLQLNIWCREASACVVLLFLNMNVTKDLEKINK